MVNTNKKNFFKQYNCTEYFKMENKYKRPKVFQKFAFKIIKTEEIFKNAFIYF